MNHLCILLTALLPLCLLAAVPASVSICLVPKITVRGENGTTHRVEWSAALGLGAVWQVLTNVTLGPEATVMVDVAVNSATRFYRVVTPGETHVPSDINAPAGMALIPVGSFQMGDSVGDGSWDELPVHTVFVSAFYMDKYEVTKKLWEDVRAWGIGNGYVDLKLGDGKAATHPVQNVNWYDVVKWCNARSQKEGRVAAYYADAALTQVYKTGQVAPYVRWDTGYRLPTEAEREKAARGGSSGHRFPWSDADTITHSRATYWSASGSAYDVSPTHGYHPAYQVGGSPYTSPVGSFAPNGYGLYDMAGNVWEWCWDWHGAYSAGYQADPHGPSAGSYRVFRGGGWDYFAFRCRAAYRGSNFTPDEWVNVSGFRSAMPTGR